MAVNLTETAAREIANIIRQQDLDPEKVRLRVGVKGGGCSGFSYILDLTETQKEHDEEWEYRFPARSNGEAKVASEAKIVSEANVASEAKVASEAHAAGAAHAPAGESNGAGAESTGSSQTYAIKVICDPKSYLYLNGTSIDFKDELMGRGFVFSNPNASTTCGCGSSFAV